LDALKYSPKDYVLIVGVSGGQSQHPSMDVYENVIDQDPVLRRTLFYHTYEGETIQDFFETGTLTMDFKKALPWAGTNPVIPNFDDEGYSRPSNLGPFTLRVNISLLRKSDDKIVDICSIKKRGNFYIPNPRTKEPASINDGIVDGGKQNIYNRDLFRLLFPRARNEEKKQKESHISNNHDIIGEGGEEDEEDLFLDFELIHRDGTNFGTITDFSFPVIGFRIDLWNTIGDTSQGGPHQFPTELKFAHFIEKMSDWQDDYTSASWGGK